MQAKADGVSYTLCQLLRSCFCSQKKSLLVQQARLTRQAERVTDMEQDQAGLRLFKDAFENLVQQVCAKSRAQHWCIAFDIRCCCLQKVEKVDTKTKRLSVEHFVEKAAGLKDACHMSINSSNLQVAVCHIPSSCSGNLGEM